MCCEKCTKILGVLLLVIGVLFLLKDIGVWSFWGLSGVTVLVLLAGLVGLCSGGCPDCKEARVGKKK